MNNKAIIILKMKKFSCSFTSFAAQKFQTQKTFPRFFFPKSSMILSEEPFPKNPCKELHLNHVKTNFIVPVGFCNLMIISGVAGYLLSKIKKKLCSFY